MREEYNRYWYHQLRLQNSNGCSTYVFLICFALACLLLAGCRSHRSMIEEKRHVEFSDTTKEEKDSLASQETTTDTTKTATETEQSAVVEFVDGGGTVTIDSAGNVTLSGVKSIKGNLKASTDEQKGVTTAKKGTRVHNSKANGIEAVTDENRYQERQTKAEAPKWYQSILAKIGRLCCIAALLWALFLYLKRKF